MSSPDVWTDAKARLEPAAAALNLPIAWPNRAFTEPAAYTEGGEPNAWVYAEIAGDLSEPYELTGGVWQETGAVHLHVMVPTGSGLEAGLALRKALTDAFREQPPNPVYYRGAVLDPGGPGDEDGNWWRLSARISYSYQDFAPPA